MHDHLRRLLEKDTLLIEDEINGKTIWYVREALQILFTRGSPPVKLHIASDGGEAVAGLHIYDLLRLYPGDITGVVEGAARSMAAVILQACKTRHILRHSVILVHGMRKSLALTVDELNDPKEVQEVIRRANEVQAQVYRILSERTKKSMDEIKALCARNMDMGAEEAKALGLVDEIL